MQIIKIKSDAVKVRKVKKLILSAGNKIGAVHFIKRSNGQRRRMSFRLHVRKPTYAPTPTGKGTKRQRKINQEKNLFTVFDTNTIRYNSKGLMCGRGAYKSIPLDAVTRVSINGQIYKFVY